MFQKFVNCIKQTTNLEGTSALGSGRGGRSRSGMNLRARSLASIRASRMQGAAISSCDHFWVIKISGFWSLFQNSLYFVCFGGLFSLRRLLGSLMCFWSGRDHFIFGWSKYQNVCKFWCFFGGLPLYLYFCNPYKPLPFSHVEFRHDDLHTTSRNSAFLKLVKLCEFYKVCVYVHIYAYLHSGPCFRPFPQHSPDYHAPIRGVGGGKGGHRRLCEFVKFCQIWGENCRVFCKSVIVILV